MVTGFILKLIRIITFSKVMLWALTALLCILFFTIYENKNKLAGWLVTPDISNVVGVSFSVGVETQNRLSELVAKNDNIVGATVMSADLRLNEARSMFFVGDDPALAEIEQHSKHNDSNRLPLFTSVDESNAEIIKLINGQFACSTFKVSLESKIYPQLLKTVKSVCRSSIPSYYGYFSGYLQVYLNEEPNAEKQLQLKLIIEKIANDIYFKDVLPTQRSEKISTIRPLGL